MAIFVCAAAASE